MFFSGSPSITAIVWIKRQNLSWWVSKDAHGTDAYGYDTMRNGSSPGSLRLSHILTCSVILPVDSLSKRGRNQLQGARKKIKASWIETKLMLSLHCLQCWVHKMHTLKIQFIRHRQNVKRKPEVCSILHTPFNCNFFSPFKHLLKKSGWGHGTEVVWR